MALFDFFEGVEVFETFKLFSSLMDLERNKISVISKQIETCQIFFFPKITTNLDIRETKEDCFALYSIVQ